MTNTGLVVVVPPELEMGFRLAGVEAVGARGREEASQALAGILDDRGRALVAVYEPFLSAMPASERERLQSSPAPIVVPLPAGLEEHDEESHQARISAMLRKAVGYHITFEEKARR